jgi:hypothetical protein
MGWSEWHFRTVSMHFLFTVECKIAIQLDSVSKTKTPKLALA